MKTLRILFYSFFLLFNLVYLIYNIAEGFDWSKALIPSFISLACAYNLYFMWKKEKQPK